MYSLIIDSATKVLYLALVKDDKIIDEKYLAGQNDHAKNIVLMIEEIINNNNIKVKDLNRVVAGVGPGSYTGVRMAVTVSKMLCSLANIKLYEISTLFLMASGYNNKVISMIDARRGNIFSSVYNNSMMILKEELRNKEELLKDVIDYQQIVNENEFKVNPIIVIKYAEEVKNPHAFSPNYLRETEAERNLKDVN